MSTEWDDAVSWITELVLLIIVFILILCTVYLYGDLESTKQEQDRIASSIAEIRSDIYTIKQKRVTNITVTAYSPREKETDSTPRQTAFMTSVKNRTIGLPWHLIQQGWIPKKCVYLNVPDSAIYGGLYKINDRMNERYQYRGDVYFDDTEHAIRFGVLYNIDMIYLGECP